MSAKRQQLYDLLPTIHQLRDAENNETLKSYLNVFAEQIEVIQENVEQLYDDQFIETCAEWVVPYIGDLIGYKALHNISSKQGAISLSQRAEVANTIAYRRRKGTALVLEQLARDVTAWPTRVVEFFHILATSQYMNHNRSHNHYAPDLRNWQALQAIDTAFDPVSHTVDVRHIDTDQGKHNIKNIGIYLWRLQSYPLTKSPLIPVDLGHYFFSPLQHDAPLFNNPVVEDSITHLAEPMNVPQPINRRFMHADKELYYGEGKSVALYNNFDHVNESYDLIPSSDIKVCCLADLDGNWINDPKGSFIAIDPENGRVSLGADLISNELNLWADFHYGFSANIGGGEYQRGELFDSQLTSVESVRSQESIQSALINLAGEGVIEVIDTSRYEESLSINVNASEHIELRATNEHRPLIMLTDELVIEGGEDGVVTLDGLLIAGRRLRVPEENNGLRVLRLRDCSLVPGLDLDMNSESINPGEPSIVIESPNVTLEINDCLIGSIRVTPGAEVTIHNSLIDATSSSAVAYSDIDDSSAGGSLKITNTTIIGKVHTRMMELASNCIFDCELAAADTWSSPLKADRKQQGCVRFSYVPLNARLPRRFRCQPELAINLAIQSQEKSQASKLTSAQKAAITHSLASSIVPAFTSIQFDQAAYGQLSLSCAKEILRGADDEAEMGVFHDLYQPQREQNLRLRLREYLRFGLEAGIFYQT